MLGMDFYVYKIKSVSCIMGGGHHGGGGSHGGEQHTASQSEPGNSGLYTANHIVKKLRLSMK